MENCNGKAVMALLTGAVIGTTIGAVMGILYAPYKGRKTRRKIRHAVVGTAYDVSNFVKHSKEELAKNVQDKI